MVQMGDRDTCESVIHNLNGASCFGNKLSVRYVWCVSAIQFLLCWRRRWSPTDCNIGQLWFAKLQTHVLPVLFCLEKFMAHGTPRI